MLVHHKLSKVINHHVARRAKQLAIVHMKCTFRIISFLTLTQFCLNYAIFDELCESCDLRSIMRNRNIAEYQKPCLERKVIRFLVGAHFQKKFKGTSSRPHPHLSEYFWERTDFLLRLSLPHTRKRRFRYQQMQIFRKRYSAECSLLKTPPYHFHLVGGLTV